MDRHRCKLCHRRFANGRALGGHMRSHVVSAGGHFPSHSVSSSSFPSPPIAEEKAVYSLRENPKKSYRLTDHEFSATPAGSSSVIQDGCESDAESSLRRRPLKRSASDTAELISLVSDVSEEDVARCLMLLSRDSWSKCSVQDDCQQFDESNEYDDEDEEDEDEEEEDRIEFRSKQKKTRYQCEACRKVFRSYQALGGHRASHKRVGIECVPVNGMRNIASGVAVGLTSAKIYECPYCDRVFSSGQALGGHKRSHFVASASVGVAETSVNAQLVVKKKSSGGGIDLNLPAPMEEEPELSALSFTAEFAPK